MSPFEEVAPYKEKRKKRKQEKESCAGSQLSRHENKWRPGKEKIRKEEFRKEFEKEWERSEKERREREFDDFDDRLNNSKRGGKWF